jgi:hypothetical protein
MGTLLIGLKTVLYITNRLKIYRNYLVQIPLTQARTNLEASITQLHTHILRFLAKAIRIYMKSSAHRAFESFWKLDEVTNFEIECDRLADRVEVDATNCDRYLSALEKNELREFKNDFKTLTEELDILQQTKLQIEGLEGKIVQLWNDSEEVKRAEILHWVSSIPYLDNHLFSCEGRTPKTGEWILEHSKYREWHSSEQSKILWLHGIRKLSLHS